MAERALLGGRYELGTALGSGGFATVFRARDRHANADVAIKLVPPGFDAPRLAERLVAEGAILKRLSSRHLARVFDIGSDAHGVWLVTELVDGVPLSADGLGRALLPHEVLRVARGLLEGLAVAHEAGVVHADVKPSNILVPRTKDALDGSKLIDFGLARMTRRAELARELSGAEAGGEPPPSGVVFGTARYMAPEVLSGRAADMRSDVYSAGLVLFELLGVGDLFAASELRKPAHGHPDARELWEQLRLRVSVDPVLDDRVPPPLSTVLGRMLARDPAKRYPSAVFAHASIIDLDTAPVSVRGGDVPPSSMRNPLPSPSMHPKSTTTAPPPSRAQPRGGFRLSALPENGSLALYDTLRHLDLPMLDALARRERGNTTGRVARAVSLALRLELDAAALILEPLAVSSDVARAVGATVLAPRARRVTRARIDADRDDQWLETVPPELAALLASFAVALSTREDAGRDAARCARIVEKLERVELSAGAGEETARGLGAARVTLRMALAAARVRTGELTSDAALDLVTPLETREGLAARLGGSDPRTAFDRVVRPLVVAAIGVRVDEGRARDDLERAVRAASECGATLLEACASTAWGRMLVDAPLRAEHGLVVLERATTLLAHGDAPSLEHEAEHHRAAALVMQGRWAEAVPRLQAARRAAHVERALDREVFSASLEVVAHLALGDSEPAREAAATLGEARIGTARGRAAAFAWIARCLEALASGDRQAAEDALAEASAGSRETGNDTPDAYVIVEVLAILFDAARGSLTDVMGPAVELARFAAERGFTAFYWFDALRSVVHRVDDATLRGSMSDALARVALLLGPASRMAREPRPSAPPGALPPTF